MDFSRLPTVIRPEHLRRPAGISRNLYGRSYAVWREGTGFLVVEITATKDYVTRRQVERFDREQEAERVVRQLSGFREEKQDVFNF